MTTHTKRNVSEDDDVVHEVCLNYAVRFKLYIMCVCVHTQIIEREVGLERCLQYIYAYGWYPSASLPLSICGVYNIIIL